MSLQTVLEDMPQGDHFCSIYRTREEQLSVIIPFMLGGLKKGEACIYILDDRTGKEICYYITKAWSENHLELRRSQWQFLVKEDAYLRDGYFDPDKMIGLLKEAENASIRDGFTGLRATGEMTWIFSKLPGTEKLIEYESKLNLFFPGSRSRAICQYDENRFDEDILLKVIYAHPKVLLYGKICENPFFIPPEHFERAVADRKSKEDYRSVVRELLKS